jgi:hypothetical protein
VAGNGGDGARGEIIVISFGSGSALPTFVIGMGL